MYARAGTGRRSRALSRGDTRVARGRGKPRPYETQARDDCCGPSRAYPWFLMSNTNEPNKIIYSMIGVSKSYEKKFVLKDIYLSYFYGAKIGVLGLNGSGKSSLLRILAGADTNFEGQVSKSAGYTIGYLQQEPQLESGKTVRQIVEEGVAS